MDPVICVKHEDGWCATKRRKSLRYADTVPTLCGYYVHFPLGIERREPTCPECLAILSHGSAGRTPCRDTE